MSAVDNAIAELERRRDQIDETIAALRRLGEPQTTSASTSSIEVHTKPVKNGKPKNAAKPTNLPGPKKDDLRLLTMRQQFESGVPVAQIAARLKVTPEAIYYHVKTKKWARPKVAATAAGEQLPGKVRCPSCELWTERDPCSNCGKKVRK